MSDLEGELLGLFGLEIEESVAVLVPHADPEGELAGGESRELGSLGLEAKECSVSHGNN